MKLTPRHLLVLGAMLAFSLMALFTRAADAPIVGVAAWRAVFVALVFGVWSVLVEGGGPTFRPDPKTRRIGVIYGLCLALASSTFVGAYALTTVANTIFLHNLAPAVVFPLAWWIFREKPSAVAVTGAVIAMGGVALLSGVSLFHFSHFSNPRFLLGDFLALVSAIGYAGVLVVTRLSRREETPILSTLFVAWTVAALVLCAVALFAGGLSISLSAAFWVLGLAVICTNVPFYLLNLGMKEVSAGLASVLSLSEVVFATLLGLLVYGERLAPIGWIGGLLVLLGVLYPLSLSDEDREEEPDLPRFSSETRRARGLRLVLALVLLNGGAALALVGGHGVGVLLAWTALLALLRLGAVPAAVALEGRLQQVLGWIVGLAAAAALFGVVNRGGWQNPGVNGVVVALALVAWWCDQSLAGQETEDERDTNPLMGQVLILVLLGQAAGLIGHPAHGWLTGLAALVLCLSAFGLVAASVQGQVLAGPAASGVARMDALGRSRGRVRMGILLLLIYVAGGIHAVSPGHRGIVERWGAPLPDVLAPGLQWRMPPPIENLTQVDMEVIRRLSVLEVDTPLLTGDQSMVSLKAVVHYTVSDAHDFAYGCLVPEDVLSAVARSSLVEAVGERSQDEVLTVGRAPLEQEVLSRIQEAVDQVELGLVVIGVGLSEAVVPPAVTSAFMDVISAAEEKRTRINLAEAYAAKTVPVSRGDAVDVLEASEGEAAAIESRAEVHYAQVTAWMRGGSASSQTTLFRLGRESLERALEGTRLVLAPPSVRVWQGDVAVDPQRLGNPNSEGRRSP